jgi:hypothetical protein
LDVSDFMAPEPALLSKSEIELDGARFQGKHIAELAKKLHG